MIAGVSIICTVGPLMLARTSIICTVGPLMLTRASIIKDRSRLSYNAQYTLLSSCCSALQQQSKKFKSTLSFSLSLFLSHTHTEPHVINEHVTTQAVVDVKAILFVLRL
jgi:hypothetical protein